MKGEWLLGGIPCNLTSLRRVSDRSLCPEASCAQLGWKATESITSSTDGIAKMPTQPREDVLYRELSVLQAREANKLATPLLQEVVNFGTDAFVRCISYSAGEENVDLAPFALYRHILELTDGVEVLVANACPVPAIPSLRSAFEALLSLEFKREPPWYRLYDGPRDLRSLAQHLRRNAQYDVLYRQWSLSAHAQDFSPFLTRGADEARAVKGLRDITSAKQVTTFAVTFLIDATRLIIDKFHPGELWGNWYFREVRDSYQSIARGL